MALGGVALICVLLAVMDKALGLFERPLQFVTVAYAALFLLLAWGVRHGLPLRPPRLTRLSRYAAFLLLNLITGAYVLAWRVSADPTPMLLQTELARGDALVAAGAKDQAHLLYRDARDRFPKSFVVLMRLGMVNYQVGDFERARKYYSQALELAPPDSRWRTLSELGQTQWKLLHPREAIDLYQQAWDAGLPDDERIEWHYRIAWAYFDVSDFENAVKHYEVVAAAGKKYAAASHYNIACARAQQLKTATDLAERTRLAVSAVEHLRTSWKTEPDPAEQTALKANLVGTADEGRDPELYPLRKTPEFAAFLREYVGE
jgi:tetratricopeptide (TPR) repeat protein